MKSATKLIVAGSILAVPLISAAVQAGKPQHRDKSAQPQVRSINARAQAALQPPVYVPPMRGAPASRVGGASRGTAEAVALEVLAPDHTGLTVSPQPSLYWYLSKPMNAPVEVTVIDDQAIRPLAEIHLTAPKSSGVQSIDLSKYGAEPKPGMEYQWYVALVPDPQQRSNDILAGGTIKRIAPSLTLTAKLERASEQQLTYIYAKAGLWYDALAAVSEPMSENPDDATLHAERAALLKQVGLGSIAARDVSFASYESANSSSNGRAK